MRARFNPASSAICCVVAFKSPFWKKMRLAVSLISISVCGVSLTTYHLCLTKMINTEWTHKFQPGKTFFLYGSVGKVKVLKFRQPGNEFDNPWFNLFKKS